MYIVTVKFNIRPTHLSEFLNLMLKQAEDSLQREDNCLQFDVCHGEDSMSMIYLYEVYSSKQDFDIHLASDHFKSFSENVAPMVLDKQVECFTTISSFWDKTAK